ncbi:LOW QUALITY PROTEIN: uncharacterized protein LOC113866076 [Abrus precatorius]|uniref:LOW QUALITY PROTEIN: uncharacterized protein LOC113866076 n=1 Tax=Abrus precatorius TaxID=3816 RepID=A0A8B8LK49_ABRPR|nr:LOW QUALITY PROTEIN: uncharacterized protein LOC113866076 [Abrus precatorius]
MQKQEGREEDLRDEATNSEREGRKEKPPPLVALNHVSRLCRNVKDSIDFYTKVLGFVLIDRPQALDFDGAWLFNYGVGIHLVQSKVEDQRLPSDPQHLDPQDNHISFQCEDMEAMEKKLKERNVRYMKKTLKAEDGTVMDQIFMNDPDGFMVEICNCENLKLVPADSLSKIKLPMDRHNPPVEIETHQNDHERERESESE